MSIKKTLISLAAVAAAAAIVAGGMARADRHTPATPAPQGGRADQADRRDVVSHRATGDPQRVRDYWTPERMRHAHPAPMPGIG